MKMNRRLRRQLEKMERIKNLWIKGNKDTKRHIETRTSLNTVQNWKGFYNDYTGKTSGYTKSCTHKPTKIITGKGWEIWAAEKYEALDHLNDFGLLLNCSGISVKSRPKHKLPKSLMQYVEPETVTAKEFLLDWPDYGAINLRPAFWSAVTSYFLKHKSKVLVFCVGGHGRTGTALACLLITSCNMTAKQATKWVRESYCKHAIEGQKQEDYIHKVSLFYHPARTAKEDTEDKPKKTEQTDKPKSDSAKTGELMTNIEDYDCPTCYFYRDNKCTQNVEGFPMSLGECDIWEEIPEDNQTPKNEPMNPDKYRNVLDSLEEY
jgi:protein-tyrosine phosphatase